MKELGNVFVRDCLVATEISQHRSAGVYENAKTDRQILAHLKGDDLTRALSVIEDAQVSELEVVHGDAVEVGCVKGQAHFVDGDVEGIRGVVSRWGLWSLRGYRGKNAHYCEHDAESDRAFAPMTGHE